MGWESQFTSPFNHFCMHTESYYTSHYRIPLHLNYKHLVKGFLQYINRAKISKKNENATLLRTQARLNSVNEFIFSTAVGLHLTSLVQECASSFISILQRDCLDFDSTYSQYNHLMVTSFETVQKAWIKNQCSVTYTFTINKSSTNCRNSLKKDFSCGRGMKSLATHRPDPNNFSQVGFIFWTFRLLLLFNFAICNDASFICNIPRYYEIK